MIICPCLIWMKPVLLLKTAVHRSGVNISLSYDGRACRCQKVMWNQWNVSASRPSTEVWVARSKMRHHMVALGSAQITSAQWPQLWTAAYVLHKQRGEYFCRAWADAVQLHPARQQGDAEQLHFQSKIDRPFPHVCFSLVLALGFLLMHYKCMHAPLSPNSVDIL